MTVVSLVSAQCTVHDVTVGRVVLYRTRSAQYGVLEYQVLYPSILFRRLTVYCMRTAVVQYDGTFISLVESTSTSTRPITRTI